MADGELLARRRRCMQEQGQVQCVRLLESRVKGEGMGWLVFGGLEVMGCGWEGGQREVLLRCSACVVVLFSLSQIEFGRAHSFSLL